MGKSFTCSNGHVWRFDGLGAEIATVGPDARCLECNEPLEETDGTIPPDWFDVPASSPMPPDEIHIYTDGASERCAHPDCKRQDCELIPTETGLLAVCSLHTIWRPVDGGE